MLAAEAVRLLAMEALLPTASLPDGPFPTLAGKAVLDSSAPAITDIDAEAVYSPTISLYTPESGSKIRAPGAAMDDRIADCVLDVVAELSIIAQDENGAYVTPLAEDDAKARLVLAALTTQVRRLLMQAAEGMTWRRLVRDVLEIESKSVSVPEYGLRLQRIVTRFHLSIVDDEIDVTADGLPEPIASVAASLPDNSYAKGKLQDLAAAMSGAPRTMLSEIRGTVTPGNVTLSVSTA